MQDLCLDVSFNCLSFVLLICDVKVRRALGDFGVPIALVTMVTLDAIIPGTYTEKLVVPEGLTPSMPGRSWVVPPLGLSGEFPVWAMLAAIIPAILVYILVFMETHISE